MENASKALILAASVLVAILIIALGVRIFNNAKGSADTQQMDQTEITMFNQKFERYSNTQKGSNVKALISFAISNATTNKNDSIKIPTISHDTTSANGQTNITDGNVESYINALSNIRGQIITTSEYTVNIHYGNSGFIDQITIIDD